MDEPTARPRGRFPRWARYQLRKEATGVVLRGAPWIFRDHLSSAAEVFGDGQGLRLVDGRNQVLGYGIYEARGAIAIRVLRRGAEAPSAAWLAQQVDAALAKRQALRDETDAFRALHGESDGVPAVVVEVLGGVVVVQSYSVGADGLARLAARQVAQRLGVHEVVQKPPQRRLAGGGELRWLRGGGGARLVSFREGALTYWCDPLAGQKSGAFLDLRGLRREVAAMPLVGARVLSLFSYTGMLGRAAEHAGAREIWQVDASEPALALAASHHMAEPARFRSVVADVFDWLPALDAGERFALVVVDPPSMTSRRDQVPRALAAYRRLYRAAARHVAPGGVLVAACCTSRITRAELHRTVAQALGPEFALERELAPEVDHPVTFAEADYLKILRWRRAATA